MALQTGEEGGSVGGVWLGETPAISVQAAAVAVAAAEAAAVNVDCLHRWAPAVPASPPPCVPERPLRLSSVAADSVSGAGLMALVLAPAFIISSIRLCVC